MLAYYSHGHMLAFLTSAKMQRLSFKSTAIMNKRVSYHLSALCFSLKVSLHFHPVFSPSTYCKVILFASMPYLTETNKELACSAIYIRVTCEITVLKTGTLMGVSLIQNSSQWICSLGIGCLVLSSHLTDSLTLDYQDNLTLCKRK